MKKLLFLIHALNPAGAQKVLVTLVNNMDLNKYDITVQTLFDYGELKDNLNPNIHYKTILKCKNKNSIWFQFKQFILRRIANLTFIANKYIDNYYDFEVAFLEGECTRLINAHTSTKAKKIAWVHTDLRSQFGADSLFKSFDDYKKCYKNFYRIVCVSNSVRDGFVEKFGDLGNILTIYNIIDDEEIKEKSLLPINFVNKPGINFLMVGNFRPQKSYDRLLRVAKRLKDESFAFHITIIGDGSEKNNMEKYADELNINDVVSMIGSLNNPYPYMKQLDMLICSSLQEGLSTVVIESCILEMPVLTTDCFGMSEILDNGKYGIIVENNEESLYDGIKNVLLNPEIIRKIKSLLRQRTNYFSKKERIMFIDELFMQ